MKERLIVKCQRSVTTTGDVAQMLFYDEDKDRYAQFDLTEEWSKRFDTRSVESDRFFAEVEWLDTSAPPTFIKKVAEQHW